MDPVEFLREHAPFVELSDDSLERVARTLEIAYVERGTRILSYGGEPSECLQVLRKGSVTLELDGQELDELGPGEAFGYASLISSGPPRFDVVAQQDCLVYRLPESTFRRLLDSEPRFAEFFLTSLTERLRLATEREPLPLTGDFATPARKLIAGPPVTLSTEASIGDAARAMRQHRISSILLVPPDDEEKPVAILTDRDLRCRVLAEDLGPEQRALDMASRPLKTLPASTPLYEAIVFALRHRVHHLPLTEEERVIGVITHRDLIRHQLKSPVHLLRRLARIESGADLGSYTDEITGMVDALFWGGLEPTQIGRLVSFLNDALVERLLEIAERDLGPPPCPYRWLVFGSEGRSEQTLITDQDNALVYGETSKAAESYFSRLAKTVVDGLLAASIPECIGGFMATNWCQSIDDLAAQFRRWGDSPEPKAVMKAANFFDFRALTVAPHGVLDVGPLEEAVSDAASNRVFLAQLAKTCLDMKPPLSILRRIKTTEGRLDLKAGGLIPIVGLARIYALEAGGREGSTLSRLADAADKGIVSREGAETLAEAFRFVFRLRLRHQLEARRRHDEGGNLVRLGSLSPLEQRHLKEAFLAIRQMQEAAVQRYGLDLLG